MPRGPKQKQSLKAEVRDALLGILRDKSAPASAVASAGKTLYEMFKDDEGANDVSEATEMSVDELDAEIARMSKAQ